MSLKSMKHLLNIRFIFDKIDPAKARIIIDKADIVLVPPQRRYMLDPRHQNEQAQEA
jgi:cellobiose-specific phosphotransferase system component IIB